MGSWHWGPPSSFLPKHRLRKRVNSNLPKLVLLHRRLQGAIALAALAQLSDARLQLFTAQRRLGRLLLVVAVELFEVAPDLLLDVLKALGQLGLREEPLAAIAG